MTVFQTKIPIPNTDLPISPYPFTIFQSWFPEFHKAFHRSHFNFTANQHIISTFPICQNRLTGTRTGENNVKNRLTHVQKRWKPHSKQQNSHSKQRLRGALRRKCGGGFLHFGCQGGEMVVRLRHVLSWLRRFQCVFQAFARLICGENAV